MMPTPPPALLHPSAWPRYGDLADLLLASGAIFEPWSQGLPRFHGGPLVLSDLARDRLYDAARRVGALYDELCALVWADPALLDFFHLTPWQRRIWDASGGLWHGFARLDAFWCGDDQLQICEINADTPTGQLDALAISQIVGPLHPDLRDAMADYEPRLWAMLCRYHAARTGKPQPRRIGIVYPTDICEDLMLVRLYTRWWEARGVPVISGSPFNLVRRPDGGVQIFGQPVDLILRHYKTDWWAEARPVWIDEEPVPDPDALEGPLQLLFEAEARGLLSVVNPLGAILPQSKRAMALFWEALHRFSAPAQDTIRALIPPTFRVETLGRERLLAERDAWVLKSDFGCEGQEVVVGPWTDPDHWAAAVSLMTDGNWVAQRFFSAAPLPSGQIPNFGVYLIAGEPSGVLTRLDPGQQATGFGAVITPTFTTAPTVDQEQR